MRIEQPRANGAASIPVVDVSGHALSGQIAKGRFARGAPCRNGDVGELLDARQLEDCAPRHREVRGIADSRIAGGIYTAYNWPLVKNGTGTWTLAGVGDYRGPTLINAGTLKVGAAGVIPDTSSVTINGTATFDLGGFSEKIDGLSSSTATFVANSGASLPATSPSPPGNHRLAGAATGSPVRQPWSASSASTNWSGR
jgi:autotransporter-associated beta strand protein